MGYTMVELVVVMVLVGVLAAFTVPKMGAALASRDDAWRDGLVTALRYAQKTSVSHRRLVCVTVTNTDVTLNIASSNPSTTCNFKLWGIAGNGSGSTNAPFATSSNSSMTTAVSPTGVIYFQPDGRSSTDAAGTTIASRTITPAGLSAITVNGETGHVD
jgi:MSHA pilin protein MshC